jgi:hypothetical protein
MRVKLKPNRRLIAVVGIVVILAIIGGLIYQHHRSVKRKAKIVPIESTNLRSAVDGSTKAIAKGVTAKNVNDALFVASSDVNAGKTADARKLVEAIADSTLNNTQLVQKYNALLDSYRYDDNRDGFVKIMNTYKTVLLSRNKPELSQIAAGLTDSYVSLVFNPPATTGGDKGP